MYQTSDLPKEHLELIYDIPCYTDPLVKKTQENSGLDVSGFNKTADSAAKDDVGAFADTMSFAGLAPEVMCVPAATPTLTHAHPRFTVLSRLLLMMPCESCTPIAYTPAY